MHELTFERRPRRFGERVDVPTDPGTADGLAHTEIGDQVPVLVRQVLAATVAARLRPGKRPRTRLLITSLCSTTRSRNSRPTLPSAVTPTTTRHSGTAGDGAHRFRGSDPWVRVGPPLATPGSRSWPARTPVVTGAISKVHLNDDRWHPAVPQAGDQRRGAEVCEVPTSHSTHLSRWLQGTRLIVRPEPLHPRAQQTLFPALAFRHLGHYTDQPGDPVALDAHMRVPDRDRKPGPGRPRRRGGQQAGIGSGAGPITKLFTRSP